MASYSSQITKAMITSSFPKAPPKVVGAPTLREFIRIIQHLMIWSQSHLSQASDLELLFVCVPQHLWRGYSNQPYPTDPVDPGPVPVATQNVTAYEWTNMKLRWDFLKKLHHDFM